VNKQQFKVKLTVICVGITQIFVKTHVNYGLFRTNIRISSQKIHVCDLAIRVVSTLDLWLQSMNYTLLKPWKNCKKIENFVEKGTASTHLKPHTFAVT
jgi:hypothetical protein